MAFVELHPEVQDYVVPLTLAEIEHRGGVADLMEDGRLVVISDVRLNIDFATIERLAKSTAAVSDDQLRRQLKKLEATSFFEGAPARRRWRASRFDDPVRQALYETICHRDAKLFELAAKSLEQAHTHVLEIYSACFPSYRSFRLVPSIRLTQTLFENLHWDEHWIDGDFHTARVFANLDTRPRIWHMSHRFPDIVRMLYREHDLGRFAGRNPNELLSYINGEVLGGLTAKWKDNLPRHRIAFEPGEIWIGESRLLSHQIYYGEAALVYMWLVDSASMASPDKRFNRQIEQLHEAMKPALPVGGQAV
jgi:hypothetical protein